MKTKYERMFKTLSEKELKDVMGGLIPPPKNENEKKSPIQQAIDELICW
ncbi:bacteriocin [Bacteroides sp. GD17]|jgi:bacteriocin-like protein|nr:bacteriocin [uncultured Bacteroides sp.]